MLEKRQYSAHPPRFEYVPTQAARDFRPVLLSLMAFGNRHFAPEGAMVEVVNTRTGKPADIGVFDRATGLADRGARLRHGAGSGRKRAYPRALCAPQGGSGGRMNVHTRPPVTPPVEPRSSPSAQPAMNPRTRALLHGPIVPTLFRLAWPNVLIMFAQASDRADRDLLGRHARHRRARRHGAGVSPA
jgi:hypothetical protein